MVDAAQVAQWLAQLKQGSLTEADLEQALKRLKQNATASPVQRLLYLQTHTTDLESPVTGMSTVEGGKVYDGPDDLDHWPYQTVLEAMTDGWRIIKFPELTLAYLDPEFGGLKWEFILEK
tara:strand:+ start:702 stop:1061 length:360 start_codon:yes stop_codon:yes gene_type:complete